MWEFFGEGEFSRERLEGWKFSGEGIFPGAIFLEPILISCLAESVIMTNRLNLV